MKLAGKISWHFTWYIDLFFFLDICPVLNSSDLQLQVVDIGDAEELASPEERRLVSLRVLYAVGVDLLVNFCYPIQRGLYA